MLEEAPGVPQREKIDQAVSIIASESLRIQALALTLHGEGKESVLDLNETLRRRVLINREAAAELGQKGIRHTEQESGIPLWIRCYPLHIERVLDNLLNNAAQASAQGGEVSIRCYQKTSWAIAEITNAGEMPEEEIARYLSGRGGAGLHITTKAHQTYRRRMTVECKEGKTTVHWSCWRASSD
jgi:signal transduction histidine kinase